MQGPAERCSHARYCPAAIAPPPARPMTPCRPGTCPTCIPAPDSAAVEADFAAADGRGDGVRRRLCRQAGRAVRRRAGRGHRRVRADRGDPRPAAVLRPVAVRRRFHRRGDRPVLPDGQRAGDHDQQPPAVLHPGAEPAGRRGAGGQAGRSARWRTGARGCATCACSARTSLSDELEKLLHEKEVTGHAAWSRLFDETMAGMRITVGERRADGQRRAEQAVGPRPRGARGGRQGDRRGVRRQHQAVLADHQHAGQGQGDHRHLAALPAPRQLPQPRQHGGGRGGRCAGDRGARRLSRGWRTATTR